MSVQEKQRALAECKYEQLASVTTLRMIGQSHVEVLLQHRDLLLDASIKFAKHEKPNF